MQRTVRNRLITSIVIVLSVSGGVALMLRAMSDNIVFFYSPSELYKANHSKEIRIGGLVKEGSIVRIDDATIMFDITDNKADLTVRYRGIIPTLFREKQGVVALGKMQDDVFVARELLTKHDENYRPQEVQK